ncbi:MAG: Hpt domain-containing protein [Desulfamplus sp.]|nr:Hpt domain-containing protein [Desulfamplus sp.]
MITENVEDLESIFNQQSFLIRLRGDEELLKELVSAFPTLLSKDIANLKRAWEQNDADNIRLCAHTIKGMSSNFSANRLREAAYQIEMVFKDYLAESKSGKMCEASFTEANIGLLNRLDQEIEALQDVLINIFPEIFNKDDTQTTDDRLKEIAQESGAKLQEVIKYIEEQIIPKYPERLSNSKMIDSFGQELKKLADRYQIAFLSDYSLKYSKAAKHFDIIEIERIRRELPSIVYKIQEAINKS